MSSIGKARDDYRFDYQADYLRYCVREPFISRVSSADLVFGQIGAGETLEIVSQMPQNGVIFSDGVENNSSNSTAAKARASRSPRRKWTRWPQCN
jgi:hypothetical protein